MSQETLICRTQCAYTMCLIFYVSNRAVCFRTCAHMTICHLQVPLCNVHLWTCHGNVELCSWYFWYFIKLQIIVCTLWKKYINSQNLEVSVVLLKFRWMIINYIKTENVIEVSLPLDWITVENMVEMYQNLSVHLWKRWQPSSSMPVTWNKQNAMFPWIIRWTYHQFILFFLFLFLQ